MANKPLDKAKEAAVAKRFDNICKVVLPLMLVGFAWAHYSTAQREALSWRRSDFSYDCEQVLGISPDLCDRLQWEHIK